MIELKIVEGHEMIWSIIITGATLLLVSVLWYIWIGKALQSQRALNLANEEPVLEGAKIDTETLDDLERSWADMKTMQSLRMTTEKWAKLAVVKIKEAREQIENQYQIDRWLRIFFSRGIYINRTFYVDVHIGPEGDSITLTQNEKDILEIAKSERLRFEALEEAPLVQVELKFAEGDFNANKTQEQQILKKKEVTKFRFLLKPLKAEHCILTVVISYVSTVPVPDQIIEKVTIDKTITLGEGPETKEHTEQATVTPASTATKIVEIKTLELLVSVKSMFGMNASELALFQKALGPVLVVILLYIAFFTGQVQRSDAIWYALVSIAGSAGIPIIDALANPLQRPDSDKPDEDEER